MPYSQELTAAVTLAILLLTIVLVAPSLFHWCTLKVESACSCQGEAFNDSQAFIHFFNEKIIDATVVTFPILAALMAAGVLSSIVVSGWSFSPQALQIKWNVLNPAAVIQNSLNPRTLVRLLASIANWCS